MAAPCFENEGRDSEACRLASWVVLRRPWVVALLVTAIALVTCGA